MNKLLIALLSLLPFSAFAQSDDFGMDFSVGAEKKICKGVEFSLEGNARTQDNTSAIERWGIGGEFGFKLLKTKTFDLKASAGWEFLWQRNLAECKEHITEESYHTPDGDIIETYKDGYNRTLGYWRPRHRTTISVSGTYHPNKRWTFSLKEAVQYSHYAGVTRTTERYRLEDEDDPESLHRIGDKVKEMQPKDRVVLRSKAAAQYDIKHSPFSPFASADYGCGLNYTVDKWKFTIGTDYKINKKNKFSVFYRFQTENDDDEPNGHILGLGYSIKL